MKLTVITINYNNVNGLKKTLDSVIGQSVSDYEYIIIDGDSVDGSRELIKQNSNYISYWISEKDSGIYNAMNKGIVKANGDYILFLNSGDYLYNSDVLRKFIESDYDEDVIYGNIRCDFGNGVEVRSYYGEVTLRTFVEETINHSGCAFIKKELFDKYGLYDEKLKIVSDWKFFLVAIGLGTASVRHVDYVISVFDTNGISNNQVELASNEREKVLKEMLPFRLLRDYKKMTELEQSKLDQERKIRSSLTYKIGSLILRPLKCLKRIID